MTYSKLIYLGIMASLLLVLHGCKNYAQCEKDSDCLPVGGHQLFCTDDQLCVSGTPNNQLCKLVYPDAPSPSAIPIGAILHLSDVSVPDFEIMQTLKLGVKEVNELPAPFGKQLVLHICDVTKQSKPMHPASLETINQDVSKAFHVLVHEHKVVAVIGPNRSAEVSALASLAKEAQVPLVSPSANVSYIADCLAPGFFFRTYPSVREEAHRLAELVPKGESIGIIYSDDVYGRDYYKNFSSAWAQANGNSLPKFAKFFTPLDAMGTMEVAAKEAIDQKPNNLIVLSLAQDLPSLAKKLEPLDGGTKIFMGPGGQSEDMLLLIGNTSAAHLNRIQGITAAVATGSAEYSTFRSNLHREFDIDPEANIYIYYTYDAFYAVAVALGSISGSPTRSAVAEALKNISGKSPKSSFVGPSLYRAAIGLLMSGGVSLQGTTGLVGFVSNPVGLARNGDREVSQFAKWSIDQVKRTFVTTPLP